MKQVTDSEKTTISASIQAQITALTSLKAKIDADTDITALRADVKSVVASYRIFFLVIPQGRIIAAGDRALTISDDMITIGVKLQARISAAQTAGKDVTALNTALVDFNAKVADAKTQIAAATAKVVNLVPDQGDKTVAASNKAALMAARADIKAATTDLQAARKDSKTIVQGLKAFNLKASGEASTTVSE